MRAGSEPQATVAGAAAMTSGWWPWVVAALLLLLLVGAFLLLVPRLDGDLVLVANDPGGPRTLGHLPLGGRWTRTRRGRDQIGVPGADVSLAARGVRHGRRRALRVRLIVRPHPEGCVAGPRRQATRDIPEGGRRLLLGLDVRHEPARDAVPDDRASTVRLDRWSR